MVTVGLSGVDQARGGTHPLQWRTKQMASAHQFSAPDEHEPDEIACPFVGQHSVCDLSAETQHNPKGLCGLIMQWDLALARSYRRAAEGAPCHRRIGRGSPQIGAEFRCGAHLTT